MVQDWECGGHLHLRWMVVVMMMMAVKRREVSVSLTWRDVQAIGSNNGCNKLSAKRGYGGGVIMAGETRMYAISPSRLRPALRIIGGAIHGISARFVRAPASSKGPNANLSSCKQSTTALKCPPRLYTLQTEFCETASTLSASILTACATRLSGWLERRTNATDTLAHVTGAAVCVSGARPPASSSVIGWQTLTAHPLTTLHHSPFND